MRQAKTAGLTLLALLDGSVSGSSPERLVVHEWGTFTSVVGAEGFPLQWRPLSGGSELPGFVHALRLPAAGPALSGRRSKDRLSGIVRMETPVLYFYADRTLQAAVDVRFAGGLVTEWYPRATNVGAGISWPAVTIAPGDPGMLPSEGAASHYYAARGTGSAPLRVAGERERFLFYRGVGRFPLPLQVRLEGEGVAVETRERGLGVVVLFESRGGRIGHFRAQLRGGAARLARPALDGSLADLLADLHQLLTEQGLYHDEASAMLETWRDAWFEEGLRLFYLLPRAATDRILPLEVQPRPSELVRVMVARVEILTPEMGREALEELRRTGDARTLLERRGRFAEPLLRHAAARDPRLRSRVEALLAEIE